MYGAILGDMIGAPFEFDRGNKTKDFQIFTPEMHFTDDTVMTVAVAEALMDTCSRDMTFLKDCTLRKKREIMDAVAASMRKWGNEYTRFPSGGGYGGMFYRWLHSKNPKPYGSFGNGSAMRVSAAGWMFEDPAVTAWVAGATAMVTHNHLEGVKGAQATALAIHYARAATANGLSRVELEEEIRGMAEGFGYDLSRTCDEIRPTYHHVETCQQTVPEAITAFLEGGDFEDCIRTAVSLGGDTDTLACITGAMAEGYYSIPLHWIEACRRRLDSRMLEVVDRFENEYMQK